MAAELHTFSDIFGTAFPIGDETVVLNKISIPIIQRDYAQGRTSPDIEKIRNRFLDSLYKATPENPITLDFVYGDIDASGTMTPLDGQQRLTTLFLLYWYAAKKCSVCSQDYSFLSQFSYETRYSAAYFCNDLISKYTPSFSKKLSDEIIDQSWFPLEWKKDPTVSSMLVMLDAINVKFCNENDLWNKLKQGAISFYFLPIKDMGLTDELYIKMNSRGKPLTQFEHFKAELESEIKKTDENAGTRISAKIDREWTDLLWDYRDENHLIDDGFLHYFRFICDVICYKNNGTTMGRTLDEFDLINTYFSPTVNNVADNISLLEEYFDCWKNTYPQTPKEMQSDYISNVHCPGKIKIDGNIDLFEECVRHNTQSNTRIRPFPLPKFVLLYAVIQYLKNKNAVNSNDFSRRLRVINNLVLNSEDQLTERSDNNRLPAILKQVENIVVRGNIDTAINNTFNPGQIDEENRKLVWTANNTTLAESLFELEDHELLFGQIDIVGLDDPSLFQRFIQLFSCNWDLVDCALMTVGNYARVYREWRFQLGTKTKLVKEAWRLLFHRSADKGFDNTHNVLTTLLSQKTAFNDSVLQEIISEYLMHSENDRLFTWRYYYIKYPVFRPGYYGKYSRLDTNNNEYEYLVMTTNSKWSENTYQPFLKAIDSDHLDRDDFGRTIIRNGKRVENKKDCFVVSDIATKNIVQTIQITQNQDGIDTEDRIQKMKQVYSSLF